MLGKTGQRLFLALSKEGNGNGIPTVKPLEKEKGFKTFPAIDQVLCELESQTLPLNLLETRGFPLSWGKEVVEEGNGYYPGGFNGEKVRKKECRNRAGKMYSTCTVIQNVTGVILLGNLQLWSLGLTRTLNDSPCGF
nr:hypothetical protein [Tanacetum cinerariifolium]